MPTNVWLLMVCGAIAMCGAPMMVFVGGIVGAGLAPQASLATLPLAMMVVGTATVIVPVTLLMQRFGRKIILISGALTGGLASLGLAFSLHAGSFWGFVSAAFLLGANLAVVQQYRFAAMESVPVVQAGHAAARVLLGGLVAAIVGPELAVRFKSAGGAEFVGSFIALASLYAVVAALLCCYRMVPAAKAGGENRQGRPWGELLRLPALWAAIVSAAVGYAMMSFIMTATPVSMHLHFGHSLEDTKWVIQSHILAMFIPSFFSGALIARWGVFRLLIAGVVAYLVSMMVASSGQGVVQFWLALIFLGIGWNFLFVGGTALLPSVYRHQEQYRVQALNEFCVFGVQATAALSSGWVAHRFGWDAIVWGCLPLLVFHIGVILLWQRDQSQTKCESPSA
ncbi:MAG: MFS transporter [Hahellaceae bacterium]|nr:MFS transporter [Hahellaceae bacterium]MCP5168616.1 MFS transporter [Hahellaceae bacterium]